MITSRSSRFKDLLHVGCGPRTKVDLIGFNSSDWRETRLDIDGRYNPDIISSMTDMGLIATGSFDALYSSHNIEHIYPHEVSVALAEFHRVLKPDGVLVLTCPDLQSVCKMVAQDKLLEPLYQSPAGPISAIDILFGHRASIKNGMHYMAHKTGFTYSALVN